jgi:hypothetical protein
MASRSVESLRFSPSRSALPAAALDCAHIGRLAKVMSRARTIFFM